MIILSIILNTYNRANLLKQNVELILSNKELAKIDFELIVCDDCSLDDTQSIMQSFCDLRIKYMRNQKNIGVFSNFQNGINAAKGKYIIGLSDDDYLGETSFYFDAITFLETEKDVDLVFGRLCTFEDGFLNKKVVEFPFKKTYNSHEFLEDWIHGGIYAICNSCFIYKKEILQKSYPQGYLFGNTLDYFITYKSVKQSQKIIFLDKIAYHWRRSTSTSLSGSEWGNVTKLSINTLAFAIEAYYEKELFDKIFFNKYALNSFSEIESNFFISQIENIFLNFYMRYKNELNTKSIYIYGYGEVGMKFQSFLLSKNIMIKSFIDDYRSNNNDILSLDSIENNMQTLIIIATFKYKLILKIYKKLMNKNISMLDFSEYLWIE